MGFAKSMHLCLSTGGKMFASPVATWSGLYPKLFQSEIRATMMASAALKTSSTAW